MLSHKSFPRLAETLNGAKDRHQPKRRTANVQRAFLLASWRILPAFCFSVTSTGTVAWVGISSDMWTSQSDLYRAINTLTTKFRTKSAVS